MTDANLARPDLAGPVAVSGAQAPGAEVAAAEEQLRELLRFERLLADVSSSLATLDDEALEAPMTEVVRQVVLALGYDRGSVSELSPDGTEFLALAAWARPGFEAHRQPIGLRTLPWYAAQLLARRTVCLSNAPDQLPADAVAEREYIARIGMKSHLALPLVAGSDLVGMVGLGSLTAWVDWPESVLNRLRILGSVVGSTIVRVRDRRRIAALTERLESENLALRTEIEQERGFEQIVGKSPALRQVLRLIAQVAPTDATVLVSGETGTGKELVARAVHARSHRAGRTIVTLNCAALPPGLVESELFGHEPGAFTGAVGRKLGRFEVADGGTLFLDEVGDLPPDLQTKLLRVLQQGEFERLGSSSTRRVDVRVIAATNQDLERAVAERRFRADLFYRLSVFPLPVPPLRERREDIPLLVWYFVHKRQAVLRRSFTQISKRLLRAFEAYPWPGNVRELEHVVERAMILSEGTTLRLDEFGSRAAQARSGDGSLEDVERVHVQRVLADCGWRINGDGNAADRLGLHPSTLRFRMKKLGIARPARAANSHE